MDLIWPTRESPCVWQLGSGQAFKNTKTWQVGVVFDFFWALGWQWDMFIYVREFSHRPYEVRYSLFLIVLFFNFFKSFLGGRVGGLHAGGRAHAHAHACMFSCELILVAKLLSLFTQLDHSHNIMQAIPSTGCSLPCASPPLRWITSIINMCHIFSSMIGHFHLPLAILWKNCYHDH